MIDHNNQAKMTIASNKEINLLKLMKLKLNANNYGKNSLIFDAALSKVIFF